MKRSQLLHNPQAGEKDFSKKELVKLIEKQGFECIYSSVKKEGWDAFADDTDFLIVAGGDGTVRRAAKALVKRKVLDKRFPIALLPHGTANNVATTLGICGEVADIIKSWHKATVKKFDIGKVLGLEDDIFFLEGFGFGIFPKLMKVMNKMKDEGDNREERILTARAVLYDIVLSYKARNCKITADGADHSGKYILVEVMNTTSIGPNLGLSSSGDPGDGEFEVVLIPESHQKKFENFLLSRINGEEKEFSFTTLKAKEIQILWEGKDVHTDDEIVKIDEPTEFNIEIMPGILEFLVEDKNPGK